MCPGSGLFIGLPDKRAALQISGAARILGREREFTSGLPAPTQPGSLFAPLECRLLLFASTSRGASPLLPDLELFTVGLAISWLNGFQGGEIGAKPDNLGGTGRWACPTLVQ
jgi:hypothetical protein